MADEENIDVVIEQESADGATETSAEKSADSRVDPAEELKRQFAELQTQAESDRKAREDAIRRASMAEQEARRYREEATAARTEAVESQYDTVSSGLAAAQAEVESAKRDIRAAAESGDYDKQAEAYDRLAAARAKYDRLDVTKRDLEMRKSKPSDDDTRRVEAPQPASDPIEQFISSRTQPTAEWLRAHRDWLTDPKKNAKLTAAHHDALAEGINTDTPQYFDHVEKFIGLRKQPDPPKERERDSNGQFKRKETPPVAPVSASGGSMSGNGSGETVRLTKAEAAAATDGTHTWAYDDPSGKKRFKKGDPIGVPEFARRKRELMKQGFYDRTYTES